MPIQGLTTRDSYKPNRAIPRLGKLRKGAPKPVGGNRPGSDLKHFRVDFAPQYQYLQDTFDKIYGSEPTEFQVKFIGNTVEDVFPTGYEARNATTLLHLCDGETQTVHWNHEQHAYDKTPTACTQGKDFDCGCKQIGRLNIMLPELTNMTGVMGKFQIETHSIFDIMKLFHQLSFLEDMFGKLMFLPAIVGRADEEKSYTKQNGQRAKKHYSLMYVKYYMPLLQDYIEPQLNDRPQLASGEFGGLALPEPGMIEEYTDIILNIAEAIRVNAIPDIEPRHVADALENAGFDHDGELTEDIKVSILAVVLEHWHSDDNGQVDVEACFQDAKKLANPDQVEKIMNAIV